MARASQSWLVGTEQIFLAHLSFRLIPFVCAVFFLCLADSGGFTAPWDGAAAKLWLCSERHLSWHGNLILTLPKLLGLIYHVHEDYTSIERVVHLFTWQQQ